MSIVYTYKAIKPNGDKVEGSYTALSENEVLAMLKDNNYYPIKVEKFVDKDISGFFTSRKVKAKDIAVFSRQFYVMLNAGITIVTCLDILRLQTQNKKLKGAVNDLFEDVQKGLTLSEALIRHDEIFPDLVINLVEAGEISGNLDVVMERLADHYEKENKINNKIKGAMVYPIILSIVAILVVIFLLTTIMPMFIGMFESSGVELPLPTRILLVISHGLTQYWYLFIAIGFLGFYLIKRFMKSDGGKRWIDQTKLKIPVVKDLSEKVVTSRFTRTLSTLLSSGVLLIQALEIVAKVSGNKVVEEGILRAKDDVRKGVNLSTPISHIKVFSPMVISMLSIGEESGTLDEILNKTADFYDEEIEVAVNKFTTMFEPLLIVIMAVVIGFIVIAMALPMFDVLQTVQ